MTLLDLHDVHASYGEARVLHGLTCHVDEGEVVVMLGRNGMGKTSTLRTVVGWPHPTITRGRITFAGVETTAGESFRIGQLGIGYVPQGRRIFPSLSVDENLRVIARTGTGGDAWSVGQAYELFPRLRERQRISAGHISGGEQQMLAIARALVTNPRLLILDEPSEGLAPAILQDIVDTIASLRGHMTVLVAEQDIRFALELADRVLVIDRGRVAAEGTPHEIDGDAALKRRTLGVG